MDIKKLVAGIFVIAIIVYFGCSSKPSGETLVTVNGKDITEADLNFLADINPRIKVQISSPFGKKQVLGNLVDQELLYQDSIKKGLQNEPKVQAKADLYKRVIIAQALVDEEIENAAKKYYEDHKADYEKLQFSDIVIKFTEQDAKKKDKGAPKDAVQRSEKDALALANKVKERLDAGEDFAKLANEVSEDPATKGKGGDQGLAAKTEPRFDRRGWGPVLEKAFSMKVGEVSGPIKTKDSYHIITVTKGSLLQPYDTVEQGVVFKIQAETRNKLLGDLKKDAKIKYAASLEPQKPAEQKPGEPSKPEEGIKPAPEGQPFPQAMPPKELKPEAQKSKQEVKPEAQKPGKEIKLEVKKEGGEIKILPKKESKEGGQ